MSQVISKFSFDVTKFGAKFEYTLNNDELANYHFYISFGNEVFYVQFLYFGTS